MLSIIKNNLKYVFIFLIVLSMSLYVACLDLDEVWCFGFSYNIFTGLVPYKDFNMIVTPFSSFYFLPFFKLFGANFFVYQIGLAFFITFFSRYLFKIIGNKTYFVLLFMLFPFSCLYPNYNIMCYFFIIFLIYLEKYKNNDYLIGVFLALLFLTKQTLGMVCLIPAFIYLRDKKKIFKRFISFFLVISMFLFYSVINDCLYKFIDLCFLGLFDFAGDNSKSFNLITLLSILIILYTVYLTYKNRYKKDNTYLYILMGYSLIYPLFDLKHFQILIMLFLFIVFYDKKSEYKINFKIITFEILLLWSLYIGEFDLVLKPVINTQNNIFSYRPLIKYIYDYTYKIDNYLRKKYNGYNYYFLDGNSYYFKLIDNKKIDYLDMPNMGNWGYNGSFKYLNSIQKKHGTKTIFLVYRKKLSSEIQVDRNVISYVKNNGKKIDKIMFYDIYILEDEK